MCRASLLSPQLPEQESGASLYDLLNRCCVPECRTTPEGIGALCGAMLIANIFLGTSNSSTVQPIVGQQRSILYR